MGSMVAYRGNIKFEREGVMEHGVGKMLKRAFTGEAARLGAFLIGTLPVSQL